MSSHPEHQAPTGTEGPLRNSMDGSSSAPAALDAGLARSASAAVGVYPSISIAPQSEVEERSPSAPWGRANSGNTVLGMPAVSPSHTRPLSLEARFQATLDELGAPLSRRLAAADEHTPAIPLRNPYEAVSADVRRDRTLPVQLLASPADQRQTTHVPETAAPQRSREPTIGIFDFRVVERVAQGGTGSVYLATRGTHERYALKVLRRENLGNEESLESLRREAELLSLLQHPNVVRLLAMGDDGGEPFLVMEFIDGLSLAELLSYPLRMPLAVGVTIVRDVLRALSYIHDLEREGSPRGIIHGDVSPQNLLVGSDGRARLLDFGVAREPGLPARDSVVRCKPRYASPELLMGDPLGAESDLFAVGAVLFQVLTGRKLFSATDPTVLFGQVTRARIPTPSSIYPALSKAFDEVCKHALERDRTRRYQRAGDMLQALERAAEKAGLPLSDALVAEWVIRVQKSRSEDVELDPAEVQSLLQPTGANHGIPARDPITTAPPPGSVGPLARLSQRARFAIGGVVLAVAVGVVLFALVAPETFVRLLAP
jgi:serine/threonine protein kinase